MLLPLHKAAGLVLAQDVYSPIDLPPFQQAAMDGYAFAFDAYAHLKKLEVRGEIPAGHNKAMVHVPGQAVRIFTGAPVPQGADTVVMQEKITLSNQELFINDTQLQKGANVRPRGSEIKAGAVAMSKGTLLTPAAIGFLASLGMVEVPVYPKPSVAVIVTGNELQAPGKPLQAGQVYESNSFTLAAALKQFDISDVAFFFALDDLNLLQKLLRDALLRFDMILLTGGVSVGSYDFVVQAAAACGVTQQFHKVAQRPGKPLFFGTYEHTLIFGLPGNPASVLTCFYQYVVLALEGQLGKRELVKHVQLPLAAAYSKKPGLTHFLKARCDAQSVMPLQAQESYKLASFATANCLIELDETGSDYTKGVPVAVHLLPSC